MAHRSTELSTRKPRQRRLWGAGCALLLCGMTGWAQAQTPTLCAAHEFEMGVKYQQRSAEISALQQQVWRQAKARLADILKTPHTPGKLAIMTDLDETVIDNTGFATQLIDHCQSYSPARWQQWERTGSPALIPGALDFLKYADAHGVAIFYVSDRTQDNWQATRATLARLGLPQLTRQHLLLAGPSKETRRRGIEKDHQLVIQLGDSLADFSPDFLHAGLAREHALVRQHAQHFGHDWFILPNSSYGSWTNASLSEQGPAKQ